MSDSDSTGGPPPEIEVRTLGMSEVLVAGKRSGFFDSRKLLFSLLLVLSVERERSRDALMGLFWPDRSPDRARRSLNQALYELRQHLGEHWIKTPGDTVRVNGFLTCDLPAFEEGIRAGRRDLAIPLFEGSFLQGFSARGAAFGQWCAAKRALVDRLARTMFKEEVEAQLRTGHLDGAIVTARRWVELDPHDDEGQHRLIELLASSGDRAAALRRYDRFRALLLEDDLKPLEETETLIEAVRAGQVPDLGIAARIEDEEAQPGSQPPTPSGPTDTPTFGQERMFPEPEYMAPATHGGTMRWVAGGAPGGPRLCRILPDGQPGEVLLLGRSKTVLGRDVGDLTFPDDPDLAPAHAVILVRQAPSEAAGGKARYILRPADPDAEVFVRIRGSWPVRPGDRLAAGGVRIRLLP